MSSYYHIDSGFSKGRRFPVKTFLFAAVVGMAVGGYFFYPRPSATAEITNSNWAPSDTTATAPKITTPMPWPAYGHAAYGVADTGVLAASDEEKEVQPVPIASLAKVITALAILEKKPLQPGEQGPLITFDEHDIELYRHYVRKSGVVVPVEAGKQITQRQAMNAMLMTSANNMSDTLVRWAFGSVEEYTAYANKMLVEQGYEYTYVADASGFSPDTVSTAEEMTKIGFSYMQHPVLKEIAMTKEATIPVAGVIQNYNSSVNEDGVFGIKIGNTDEAKRCFIVADIGNGTNEEISVAVVLGAEDFATAMKDARVILSAGNQGYSHLKATIN